MKILIVNLHSALNLGDDAIMHSTLSALRAWRSDLEITAAGNDPESWRKFTGLKVTGSFASWAYAPLRGGWKTQRWVLPVMFLGLPALAAIYRLFHVGIRPGRTRHRELLRAYYEADLVLSCGGGNFYAHKRFSPFLFLALLALVFPAWLGKRVVMLPQSIGPIEGRLQRLAARYAFGRVDQIFVREALSAVFLRGQLAAHGNVRQLPDLAFGLTSGRAPHGTAGPLRVGITVIDRGLQHRGFRQQERYEQALVALCAHLTAARDLRVTLLCQVYGPTADQDDRGAVARLADALAQLGIKAEVATSYTDATQVIAACAEMDLVVASRMHSAIFALLSGTPTVAIAYQPKALGMMAALGLEAYCLPIETVTAEGLIERVEATLRDGEALSARVLSSVAGLRQELAGWPALVTER